MNLLDKAIAYFDPTRAARRAAVRQALVPLKPSKTRTSYRMAYDAATRGHRSAGWRPVSTDANAEVKNANARVRDVARDLCRNNPYARSARRAIVTNTIGTGILPSVANASSRATKQLEDLMIAHFDTTAIDARRRNNLYGLQALAMKTVVESGECLVRFRQRRISDGLPLPFQLEVLEPDHLDTSVDGDRGSGGFAIQGIEYNAIGQVVAYHLFDVHPGDITRSGSNASRRIPADLVAHVFDEERAGQARGISWFAPVVLRLHDLYDYSDAQLIRQKIAACFAAFVETDNTETVDFTDETTNGSPIEVFEPGLIERLAPGESVQFASPPGVGDYPGYVAATLREISAGLGISYEVLSGDLSQTNFSSARMGWLEFQRSIDHWRQNMLIPQFCDRVGIWFLQAAALAGVRPTGKTPPRVIWTSPRREMISPKDEVGPTVNAIRAGLITRSEAIRRLGFDPAQVDLEHAADMARADELGLVFDTDPRQRAQNGGTVGGSAPAGDTPADPEKPASDEDKPADEASEDTSDNQDDEAKK